MPSQPAPHVGTAWKHPEIVLSRVGQCFSYQCVGNALIAIWRGDFGVLHIDGIVIDQRVHQFRLSVIQGDNETGVLDIVLDIHRLTPNANTVRERYSFSGLRIVDGNAG